MPAPKLDLGATSNEEAIAQEQLPLLDKEVVELIDIFGQSLQHITSEIEKTARAILGDYLDSSQEITTIVSCGIPMLRANAVKEELRETVDEDYIRVHTIAAGPHNPSLLLDTAEFLHITMRELNAGNFFIDGADQSWTSMGKNFTKGEGALEGARILK